MSQGFIYDQYGNHATKHQDAGVDEISVTGLSGLLADDQHVLDVEVLAYLLSLSGALPNLKLFINAAGTEIGWALGAKVATFTRDMTAASGNVSYTGFGFAPQSLICLAFVSATLFASWAFHSLGGDVGFYHNWNHLLYATGALINIDVGAAGNEVQSAVVNSIDSDGFTLTWTKIGSPTGTIIFYVLGLQ